MPDAALKLHMPDYRPPMRRWLRLSAHRGWGLAAAVAGRACLP